MIRIVRDCWWPDYGLMTDHTCLRSDASSAASDSHACAIVSLSKKWSSQPYLLRAHTAAMQKKRKAKRVRDGPKGRDSGSG